MLRNTTPILFAGLVTILLVASADAGAPALGSATVITASGMSSPDVLYNTLVAQTRLGVGTSPPTSSAINIASGTDCAHGIQFGSDSCLYRAGSTTLKTDGQLTAQLLVANTLAAGNYALDFTATGDTDHRFRIVNTGELRWGSGSTAWDTGLVRSNTGILALTGSLVPNGGSSTLGQSGAKFTDLWVVNSHVGDQWFANNWRYTEDAAVNTMPAGLSLLTDSNVTVGKWTVDGVALPQTGSAASMPQCDAGHRAMTMVKDGDGSTTPDTMFVCLRSASGTYAWRTLVTG